MNKSQMWVGSVQKRTLTLQCKCKKKLVFITSFKIWQWDNMHRKHVDVELKYTLFCTFAFFFLQLCIVRLSNMWVLFMMSCVLWNLQTWLNCIDGALARHIIQPTKHICAIINLHVIYSSTSRNWSKANQWNIKA